MNLLKNRYSLLINSFLFANEQIIDEEMNEIHVVIEDNNHLKAQIFLIDFKMSRFFYINASTVPSKLFSQNSFVQELLNAYKNDYDKRFVKLKKRKFKRYIKIVFINK